MRKVFILFLLFNILLPDLLLVTYCIKENKQESYFLSIFRKASFQDFQNEEEKEMEKDADSFETESEYLPLSGHFNFILKESLSLNFNNHIFSYKVIHFTDIITPPPKV